MNQASPGGRGRVAWLAIGLAVLAIVVAIGTPLLGLRVFAGTDLMEGYAPWDEAPPDAEVSNPLVSDLVDSSLPDRKQAIERLRDGDLPLWQPYANGGRPLGALPNLGLLSPLNWPYLVLPLWFAPAVTQLLTLAVSLVGAIAWLGRAGLSRTAAAFGALAWTFSGYAVVYAGFPAGHITALLPLGLWAADRATDRTLPWTRAVPVALVVAVMWFEGFPQVTAFALAAMGAWALATVADRAPAATETAPRPRRIRSRVGAATLALAAPLVGVVLGTMLATVQLAPFAADTAGLDLSAREQTPDDHLPLGTAVTVMAPDALGETGDGTWFGPINELEVQGAVAATALAMATIGLATTPRRRRWRTAAVTVMAAGAAVLTWIGGPLLAAAQATPLFALADVHRVRLLVVLGVVVLAAAGFDRVLRGPAPRRRELAVLAGLLVVAAVGGAVVTRAATGLATEPAQAGTVDRAVLQAAALGGGALAVALVAWWRPRWRAAGAVVVVALTVVAVLPLPGRFWPRTDRELFYARTPTHQFLQDNLGHDRLLTDGLTMLPGTTTWYGLRTAAAHAFPTPEWRDLLEAVDPDVYARLSPTFPALALTPEVAASPVLDRLAVRYLVRDPDAGAWTDPGAPPVVDDTTALVHERTSALPRIRWAGRAEVITDPDNRIARLADPELRDDTVVLSSSPDGTVGASTQADVEIVRDGGDAITVDVDADGAGWLVVADTLDDWSARIDDAPTELVEADHAGGAVAVPHGVHRVELSYTPSGWRTGLLVSALAALALLGLAGAARWRR